MRTAVGLCVVYTALLAPAIWAGTPNKMNFQGRISANGTVLPDDSYSIVFRIYDDSTSGNVIWSETQQVATANGTFSVLLGSINPLTASVFTGASRYVGVQVDGEAEVSPRASLVSVPYAFQAGSASEAGQTPGTAWVTPYFRAIDQSGALALTIVSVFNADTLSNSVTLAFYNQSGVLIDQCSKSLGPGQLWLFKSNGADCPGVTSHEGYIKVTAQYPVAPAGVYMAQDYGSPTTQSSSASLVFFKL